MGAVGVLDARRGSLVAGLSEENLDGRKVKVQPCSATGPGAEDAVQEGLTWLAKKHRRQWSTPIKD